MEICLGGPCRSLSALFFVLKLIVLYFLHVHRPINFQHLVLMWLAVKASEIETQGLMDPPLSETCFSVEHRLLAVMRFLHDQGQSRTVTNSEHVGGAG